MKQIDYKLTLRLVLENKSFGPGPMGLLQGVEQTGSLHKSAENMGMSYSKAWTMIKNLEKEWGFELLIRQSGGMHGGGSVISEQGKDLLSRYISMLKDVEKATEIALDKYFGDMQ